MKRIVKFFGVTAPAQLGRCAFCMRSAFFSAVAASLCAAAALQFGAARLGIALAALAAMLTLLWLAHLAAFAVRAAARRHLGSGAGEERIDRGRRDLFPAFARALGASAVLIALPVEFAKAAQVSFCGACTEDDACGSGWKCCTGDCKDGKKKCYQVTTCADAK